MADDFIDDPTIVDPDEGDSAKFAWDKEFQRHIAALLISDRQFLLQSIDLVKPNYFSDKAHSKVIALSFEFFKKYRLMPKKEFLVQELKTDLKGNKALPYYLAEVNVLFDYFKPGAEAREYLQDKILCFAKIQSVKHAFHDSLKLIDESPESEKTWDAIYEKMREAMQVQQNFDLGLDYLKTIKDRYAQKAEVKDQSELFISGLDSVDKEIQGGGWGRGEVISVVAGSGVGKCYKKNTKILMYDGSLKDVQDVMVGDLVMGEDSTPRRVLNTHSGRDQMYEIMPVKGESHTVNSEHILVLKSSSKTIDRKSRCANTRYFHNKWKVGDHYEIPVKDFLKESKRFRTSMKLYRKEVEFPAQPVLIDPYLVGVWLGDGTARCTDITTCDMEVVNELWHIATSMGLNLNEKEAKGLAFTYSMTHNKGLNTFLESLKAYGMIKNKHVPAAYKTNSREIRLMVLAGLLDSDGSKSQNCFDFINKNETLADDVVFLARSLGLAAYKKPSKKKCQNGIEGDYWRVTISGDTSSIPVKIQRKQCHNRKQIKDVLITGFEIQPVGEDQYYGFETDGNHLFLLGDFTVSHNSVCLACLTATNLLRGKKCVYITLELAEDKVANRMDSILTEFPIQNLVDHQDKIFEKLANLNNVKYEGEIWPLVIKKFPGGTATINTIRAYLSQLRFHGFDPDMVVVDYIGEMKDHPGMKIYESRELIVKELRGMADQEKVFVATAMQPNRDFKKDMKGESTRLDEHHLADAFGQIRPLDCCISLMQNDNEKILGIGRAFVIKMRDGKSRYQFYLGFNKENLKITEINQQEYIQALNAHKEYVSEEVRVDMVRKKGYTPKDEVNDEIVEQFTQFEDDSKDST